MGWFIFFGMMMRLRYIRLIMNKVGFFQGFVVLLLMLLSVCGGEFLFVGEMALGIMWMFGLEEIGIDFVNQLFDNLDCNIIEYLYYYNGGGVVVGDINNDGLEDFFFMVNE